MRTNTSRALQSALLLAAVAGPALAQQTRRISEHLGGGQALDESNRPAVSAGGRFVAFNTFADDLSPDDANGTGDVYLKDRATAQVHLISRSPLTGMAANGSSSSAALSADGRWVVFRSSATNLFPLDTNGTSDVYLYDREAGFHVRLSNSEGVQTSGNAWSGNPKISADGNFVAFESDATDLDGFDLNFARDVFLHNRLTGTTERISRSALGGATNGESRSPSVSADGRYVAFVSEGSNLVATDTNGASDIFVRDTWTDTTELVSVLGASTQLTGDCFEASISGDGSRVAFTTLGVLGFGIDLNGNFDVAVRDRNTSTLHVASVGVFGITGDGFSARPAISADGKFVAFDSFATDLVVGDTNDGGDVFRAKVGAAGSVVRVSVRGDGSQADAGSTSSAISADGSQVSFDSFASDLVPGDLGFQDVFVRNLGPNFPALHCVGKPNSLGCTPFLSFEGVPSTTAPEPFSVRGHDFLPTEAGLLLYGTNGRGTLDFHGGKLCVKAPVVRWNPVKQAQNTGILPCGGLLRRNFNNRIQSGIDPALTAGQVVNAQWLQRDVADPAGFGDALSNGLQFTIGN